jgi:hypothetical protein
MWRWEVPLIPNPILKALSMIRKRRVEHLLMGGQACVLYGAAEFSRDLDIALLMEDANLDRLATVLDDLRALVIAVPPFEPKHLDEGLAVHFRCQHPDIDGLRTQRDKDWPMIRRLVDVNYLSHRDRPTPEQVAFWLRQLRNPELLVEVARHHPETYEEIRAQRPLLELAASEPAESGTLARALRDEEEAERQADVEYWRPLKKRLTQLRWEMRRSRPEPERSTR